MKASLLLLTALAAGAVAGHFLLQDNGYVMIHFRGWVVEMSVPILLFVLIVAYLAARILIRIWQAPRQLGEAASRARARRAGRKATEGYIALAEGRLARGEKLLTRDVRQSETPLLNYLAAARAAQAQGDINRRDQWLDMARQQEPAAEDAVWLTRAEMQLAEADQPGARKTLEHILEHRPDHPQAQTLMGRLLAESGEWEALDSLVESLGRKGPDRGLVDEWTVCAAAGLLENPDLDSAGLDRIWSRVPRKLRQEQKLALALGRAQIRLGNWDGAARTIAKALANQWSNELALLYGKLEGGDLLAWLNQAEKWLRDRPEDAGLLLTAGRLCMRNQLWGKARSYLESSIAIDPSPDAFDELGRLMLQVGEDDEAASAFRRGLALTTGHGPALPGPEEAIREDG